ncbi:MAG: hypothetical protein P8X64_14490 [Anaerolineales bacterium]|jgi:hypothetical protein
MEDGRAFLENLIGDWMLNGDMRDVRLQQEVKARWVLGHKYVSMHFKSTTPDDNPTSQYEAIYHIGFNADEDLYVFHLLDTTDVPVICDMGLGKRDGNRIPFLFDYEGTMFINVLTWHPDEVRWTFDQEYEEGGELSLFARKEMVKVESSSA